jgi:hypothetical protein
VRIGAPQRPEFAAWRYGDQFGRRRRRQLVIAGSVIAGVVAIVAGGAAAGVGIGGFTWGLMQIVRRAVHGNPNAQIARVPYVDERRPLVVRRRHLSESSLDVGADGGIALLLTHEQGRTRMEGQTAARAASVLMPAVNRFGGSRDLVRAAVHEIEEVGSADAFLARVARVGRVTTQERTPRLASSRWAQRRPMEEGLFRLQTPLRLALEMALHEEQERRALEGELAELEAAWRSAEEIAAIADDLLLPESVDEFVRRERDKGGR